jgi:hypothetical protein
LLGVEEETPLIQASRSLDVDGVEAALAAGESVATRGQHDWTPLHWSCRNASENPEAAVAVTRALLAAGAEVGSCERQGRRPLHLAARSGEVSLVEVLLEAGADLTAREWERSWTALHLAARGDAGDVIRTLVEAGARVDVRDLNGASPLHRAAENGAGEAVRVLLDLGASPAATDMIGSSPLRYAREGGHFEAAVHLEAREAPDYSGPDGLRSASEAGDPVALFMMARASADGDAGRGYLEQSWEAGYPEAGLLLARLHRRGDDGPADPDRAGQILEAAAELGDPGVLLEVAYLELDGEGSETRGRALLRRAAEQGSIVAMRRLAESLDPEAAQEADLWRSWAASLDR